MTSSSSAGRRAQRPPVCGWLAIVAAGAVLALAIRMLAPKAKTIEAIVSDGDTVAVCVFGEGTNLGKLNGVVPPTGKRFSSTRAIGVRV